MEWAKAQSAGVQDDPVGSRTEVGLTTPNNIHTKPPKLAPEG